MVSATTPGPKDMAQPVSPAEAFCSIRSSTNITVADRHVAMPAQDLARNRQRVGVEIEGTLDGVEHGASAGMHGPQIDRVRFNTAQDIAPGIAKTFLDRSRHLTRQDHVEA